MKISTEPNTVVIYTDGSSTLNNIGGVGIRILSINDEGDEVISDAYRAGYQQTNSGQMEIIACIAALEELSCQKFSTTIEKIIIVTDSKYVAENYKDAMFKWSKNNWFWDSERPVQDAHLWKKLVNLVSYYVKKHIYVEITWVRGHNKDIHNKKVDEMARKAAELTIEKKPKHGPISIYEPRKMIPSKKMERGCVKVNGQRISIKILTAKLLKPQNIWCYQYQVISNGSPYKGFVDQIFSTISLDINRTYYVKFNYSSDNPRIEKIYR